MAGRKILTGPSRRIGDAEGTEWRERYDLMVVSQFEIRRSGKEKPRRSGVKLRRSMVCYHRRCDGPWWGLRRGSLAREPLTITSYSFTGDLSMSTYLVQLARKI